MNRRRLVLATGTVAVLLTLAGCWALVSMPTDETDHTIEYKLITECQGDRALEANETRECDATLFVRNMSEGVAYAEVRAIDGTFGGTKVSTVDEPDDMAIVGNLSYYDSVVLAVQPENDHREVLKRHTFTCEDVVHTDACGNETEADST